MDLLFVTLSAEKAKRMRRSFWKRRSMTRWTGQRRLGGILILDTVGKLTSVVIKYNQLVIVARIWNRYNAYTHPKWLHPMKTSATRSTFNWGNLMSWLILILYNIKRLVLRYKKTRHHLNGWLCCVDTGYCVDTSTPPKHLRNTLCIALLQIDIYIEIPVRSYQYRIIQYKYRSLEQVLILGRRSGSGSRSRSGSGHSPIPKVRLHPLSV